MEAKMTKRRIPFLTITLLTCLLIAAGTLANSTTVDWSVLTSSGGSANGDQVALDGSLGQPVTGTSSSGSTLLEAGYWYRDKVDKVDYVIYTIHLPLVSRYKQEFP
jgi:hypothetical protein